MNNPSILFLIGQLARGGAEQQLYTLLSNAKFNATVISFSQGGQWADPIRKAGYEVIELERKGSFEIRRVQQVMYYIRTLKPDIVHLFLDGAGGLYGRLGAMLAGHPGFVVCEGNVPTFHPRWFQMLLPVLNLHPKAIACNSDAARDYLVEHHMVDPKKTSVIYNGLDIDKFKRTLTTTWPWPESWRGKPIIGTVAHLTPNKSPDVWVQVAAEVHKRCPDARFAFIGEGSLRPEVEALAASLGVTDIISLIGERKDVPELLKTFDIYLMTSKFEGMPNAIGEAMACRLPCIVTDCGGCREIVHDGDTGYVLQVGDVQGIVDRVVTLLENDELRQNMALKGEAQVEPYSLAHMVENYSNLYQSVLSKR
ncbi:MAG: glycosyltransferase [Chloroflexota bacterium]